MLVHGADPNIQDTKKNTVLALACSTNAVDSIDILMNFGADINLPNFKGNYPIHMCLYRGNIDCYEKLITYSKVLSLKS